MKKILSIAFLSSTLMISSQIGSTAEVSQNSPRLAVLRGVIICIVSDPTGTPLNVRATPNGRIIGTLSNGTRVQVGGGTSGRWRKVFTESGEGYVLNSYLSNCSLSPVNN